MNQIQIRSEYENEEDLDLGSTLESTNLIDFAKQELLSGNFYLNCISNGFLSMLTFGDYFIIITILMTLLSKMSDNKTIAAAGYQFGFFSVIVFALNTGVVEAMGVYGSQAYSREDYRRVNLILRQTLLILIILFLVFGLFLGNFSDTIYTILGIEEITARLTRKLILLVCPGLFIRSISDILKAFLQSQSKIKMVGYANFAALIVFFICSYPIMVLLDLGLFGYGLGIFIYEATSFLFYAYIYFYQMEDLLRDTSLPLSENFGWIIWECCKNTGSNFAPHLSFELIIIILTQTGDTSQIASFSLIVTIPSLIYYFVEGFNIFPRTLLNFHIGRREISLGKEVVLKTFLLNGFLALISPVATILLILFIKTYGTSSPSVIAWINNSTLLMSLHCAFMVLQCSSKMLAISLELKEHVFYTGIVASILLRTIMSYVGVVYLGFTILGVIWTMNLSIILSTSSFVTFVALKDWTRIQGVKKT